MAKKVICTCSICSKKKVLVGAQWFPGDRVTTAVKNRHKNESAGPPPPRPQRKEKVASTTNRKELKDFVVDTKIVVHLCCALVIWLNLRAGASNRTANSVLKALQFILSVALGLLQAALASQGVVVQLPEIQLPKDIETVYRHYNQEPEIERVACCPKCFTIYQDNSKMPQYCPFKASRLSHECGTELWREQRFGKTAKSVPKMVYNTQKFSSWLEFFLSQQHIEDHLDATFQKARPTPGADMHDLHDTPAWADLLEFRTSKYHLVFGVYMDWFNPYGNKVAGKIVSCGAIVFVCLNLPLEIRYLPENLYIAGLTPSPSKPEATLLNHLMDPIIETVLETEKPTSKPLATFYHPEGTWKQRNWLEAFFPTVQPISALTACSRMSTRVFLIFPGSLEQEKQYENRQQSGFIWTPQRLVKNKEQKLVCAGAHYIVSQTGQFVGVCGCPGKMWTKGRGWGLAGEDDGIKRLRYMSGEEPPYILTT
ncbi:hypothetical protein R3P38DRAFT_3365308 [Favolaschia claudopus]|uniref:Transposase n=1 Tax=Favolaschia claudopus TaxID=2862362 RepID=A0AAW0AGH7_9AGAR